jgi:hypothetical protein
MYFVIIKEVKSWTVDYLTCTQLAEYYEDFNDCPVEGFSCESIHFYRLARNRYDLPAFVELCHRFHQLINPLVFLQREVRQACPSLSFWEDYNRVPYNSRRIDLDFFSVKKSYLQCGAEIARKKKAETFDQAEKKEKKSAQRNQQDAKAAEEAKKKADAKDPNKDRLALGTKWEPVGAGTGRSNQVLGKKFETDPLKRLAGGSSSQTGGGKGQILTSVGWLDEQDAQWVHQFIPRDYEKPLTEKNQEVDFIKASRDRGRKIESAIKALERNHRAPILKRPERKGPAIGHKS